MNILSLLRAGPVISLDLTGIFLAFTFRRCCFLSASVQSSDTAVVVYPQRKGADDEHNGERNSRIGMVKL